MRSVLAALVGTGCALVVATGARAAAILDANYAPASSGGLVDAARLNDAETFTVVNSGLMTSASVNVRVIGGVPNAQLTLQIRSLVNGIPSELSAGPTVLASSSLPSSSISTSFQNVNFAFTGFSVTSGEQLAIVVTSLTTAGEYYWNADLAWPYESFPAGTYGGGRAYDEGASSGGNATWGNVYLNSGNFGDNGNNPALVDFSFMTFVDTQAAVAVPEPSSWALIGVAIAATAATCSKRRRKGP